MNRTFRHLLVPSLLALVSSMAACEIISTVDRSTIGATTGSGTGGAGGATATTGPTSGTGGATAGTGGATAGTGGATAGTGGATAGTGGTGGTGGMTSSSSSSVSSSSVSSSSSASSSTGAMTSSSSGGMVCVVAANDCPATGSVCVVPVCSGGFCSTMNVAANTPAGPQVVGDCKQNVCDGAGNLTSIDNNSDHTGDGEVCTNDGCVAGIPVHTPQAAGTDCTAEGPSPKHLCGTPGTPAGGTCVECNTGADCASTICTNNVCQLMGCMDGVKNGTESDIDCGGTCAANCAVGQMCGANADCASGGCAPIGCVPAGTCGNAIKDGTETDLNCGGLACNGCSVGLICLVNSDCTSKSCNTAVSPHVCN